VKSNHAYWYFIIARVVGMTVKPIFLYYFLYNDMIDSAALISLVYLFLSGLFVIFSVPVHFDFYKVFFEKNKTLAGTKNCVKNYLSSLFSHITLVFPIILLVILIGVEDMYMAIIIFILLLSEKVFDEVQRFLIFSKEFVIWSNIFLFKTIAPLICSFILYFILPLEKGLIIYYIVFTAMSNVLIGKYMIPNYIFKLIKCNAVNFQKNIPAYLEKLKLRYFSKFSIGIMRVNVLNSDKWLLSMFNFPALFTEVTLISQFSNAINVGSNYMFISNRRSELLHKNNNLNSLWRGVRVPFFTVLLACFVLTIIISLIYLKWIEIGILPILSIILIAGSYAIFAITEPIYEYLFWNINVKILLKIEAVFYFNMVIFSYILFNTAGLEYIPVALFISVLIRVFLNMYILKRNIL
jgi:hypothetical protein